MLVGKSKWCKSAKYAVNAMTAEIEGSSRHETSIQKNPKAIGAKQVSEFKVALLALKKGKPLLKKLESDAPLKDPSWHAADAQFNILEHSKELIAAYKNAAKNVDKCLKM